MILALIGHTYKYETEATVKLFVPATRFLFTDSEPDCADDCVITRCIRQEKTVRFSVTASINGRQEQDEAALSAPTNGQEEEHTLCALIFHTLSRLTGITPRWGMMTGIRPVKMLLGRILNGESEDEAVDYLRKNFFVSEDRLSLALETARTQKPLLIPFDPKVVSLYISIPFCPTRCSYCSFVSHSIAQAGNLIPDYLHFLCKELVILGSLMRKQNLTLSTVYIGGGTPTTLTAEQLRVLMQTVQENFDLSPVTEYTVEAGRPDTIDAEKLAVLYQFGASRISINPQTLSDSVLEAIGRRHSAQQALDAFALAREAGHQNINMDLIAGLPGDTADGFRTTLDRVIALAPESITVHTLTLKRSATLYPDGGENLNNPAAEMVEYSRAALTKAGYRPYYLYRQKNTVDNLENVGWAKPGFESLYNILMMDETQTILGAGCGASTKLVRPGDITRIHNHKFPYEYINRFDELMQKKQEMQTL